jgi:hypothetical protein
MKRHKRIYVISDHELAGDRAVKKMVSAGYSVASGFFMTAVKVCMCWALYVVNMGYLTSGRQRFVIWLARALGKQVLYDSILIVENCKVSAISGAVYHVSDYSGKTNLFFNGSPPDCFYFMDGTKAEAVVFGGKVVFERAKGSVKILVSDNIPLELVSCSGCRYSLSELLCSPHGEHAKKSQKNHNGLCRSHRPKRGPVASMILS